MRGKAQNNRKMTIKPGITPAYAGKSPTTLYLQKLYRDHPRVCGEKKSVCATSGCCVGSPPRMRGKANVYYMIPGEKRITPAYAGKSVRRFPNSTFLRDHPRVCGEKLDLTLVQIHS